MEIISLILLTFGAFLFPFGITYFTTSFLIKHLTTKVPDAQKPGRPMIPRPGGPALIAGIVIGGLALYALVPMPAYIFLLMSISVAFAVGFIDDRKTMKGWFKPAMLVVASMPLLAFAMDDGLLLPWYGMVMVPTLYSALILASMPLIGNASNSLDVSNGIVTKSFILAFAFLFIAYGLSGTASEVGLIGIPIIGAMMAFHHFHKYPSKIFPGDSGAITMGVAYIGFAIITHMEIIAVIAILPAILNSFIFLSSTKKIVEHRELKGKAVGLTEDGKLKANKEKAAVSLIRLILAKGPLTELQLGKSIYHLMIFSGILAVCTSIAPFGFVFATIAWLICIKKSNHSLIYSMIFITWLLIVGMIVPVLGWFNETDPSVYLFRELLSVVVMLPVMAVFVGALVVMKRKLLKPLYKEFEPEHHSGSHP